MVLTDKNYVYSWGRGFEGQLGLSSTIEIASTPKYIKFFHGKTVTSIAAGSFYSLAITNKGHLYSWGESRVGQLGLGKHREIRTPTKVEFPAVTYGDEEGKAQETKIVSCAAGYGHTAALTENGELYTWGFNVYGQLGVGDKKNRWVPELVQADNQGETLPPFVRIQCSNYGTFAIDSYGHPYSWGKGYIGH